MANGVDIAADLVGAVDSFQKDNFHRFGQDLGSAWRKVLLGHRAQSKASTQDLETVAEGLMEGFFGPGFVLKVAEVEPRLRGRPEGWTVDVHRCISRNEKDLREVMSAVSQLMTRQASLQGQAMTMGEDFELALGTSLYAFPRILRRCNVHSEQEEMLADALLALQQPKFKLSVETSSWNPQAGPRHLTRAAVLDWESGKWHECGKDIGFLLRKAVVSFFPSQYAVDGHGRIQRQASSLVSRFGDCLPRLTAGTQLGLGLLTVLVFLGAAAVRALHSPITQRHQSKRRRFPSRALEPILEADEEDEDSIE